MCTITEAPVRELDHRTSDGFDVRLVWNSQTNRVFVAVDDRRHGESFELEVQAADALEAFRHPFSYARNPHAPHSLLPERLPGSPPRREEEDDE